MKRIQTCVAGLLLFCSLSLAAFAQGVASGAWDKLIQEANQLYRAGNYLGAVDVVKKALELAEKAFGPGHPTVATSLNNLSALYQAQGQYAQAEPLYKRSLAIWEKSLGPDHPIVAASLNNLAKLLRETNRAKEAEDLEQRVARIRAVKR